MSEYNFHNNVVRWLPRESPPHQIGDQIWGHNDPSAWRTLAGNWVEERSDMAYRPRHFAVPLNFSTAETWKTTYHVMTGEPSALPNIQDHLTHSEMMRINKKASPCYPGHQIPFIPSKERETTFSGGFQTSYQVDYTSPNSKRQQENSQECTRLYHCRKFRSVEGARAELNKFFRYLLTHSNLCSFLKHQVGNNTMCFHSCHLAGHLMQSLRECMIQVKSTACARCGNFGTGFSYYESDGSDEEQCDSISQVNPSVTGLSPEELRSVLYVFGVKLLIEEAIAMVRQCDIDHTWEAPINQIIHKIHLKLSYEGRQLLNMIYSLLEKTVHFTPVTVGVIAYYADWRFWLAFNRCHSLKGISNDMGPHLSPDEIKDLWLSIWHCNESHVLSREDFLFFSMGLFTEMKSESFFLEMMRNVFHISGGSGCLKNISCQRVCVTCQGGRVSVEEIKNDLPIWKTLTNDEMLANLFSQGITDIIRIEKLCLM